MSPIVSNRFAAQTSSRDRKTAPRLYRSRRPSHGPGTPLFPRSIALRPDNDDAYLKRGNAYLDTGRFEEAIEDFTTLHERDGDHPYALADRGMANAWLDNRELAERDFATVSFGSTGWPVLLRGRAILAMHRDDHAAVIDYLSQSLQFDPDNPFALRRWAYAYSQTGQAGLARGDIDRAREVETRLSPERVGTVFVAAR